MQNKSPPLGPSSIYYMASSKVINSLISGVRDTNTEITAIFVVLGCWVEIEDYDVAFEGLSHLLHDLAVGGLSEKDVTLPAPAGPMMTCPK